VTPGDATSGFKGGLTGNEARRKLLETGPNEPVPVRRRRRVSAALHLFANPLVLVLLFACLISIGLGDVVDAIIIAVIVLLSAAINGSQSLRAEHAIERLHSRIAPRSTVLRDGEWMTIPRSEVVPGDIIRISAGDLVPADAVLLEAGDLHVQEAALTGESMPSGKTSGEGADDRSNRVYLGTSVVSGWGIARVEKTGQATEFGDVARRLTARAPESEFERGLRQFGLFITRIVVFFVLFLIVISIALRRDPLTSLLFALALAVGMTPEFLPMITTVTLTRGAMAMAQKKVIVRRLASIQNFGSIDILCCDKTGTLTRGEMSLDQALDAWNRYSERTLLLGWINSRFESGIRSPLDSAILSRPEPAGADGFAKVDEIPFDFERRILSVVAQRGAERLLICKGAPESVFPLCTYADDRGRAVPFTAQLRRQSQELFEAPGTRGIRVLAVASRPLPPAARYERAAETNLTLNGLLTFEDPPLEDVQPLLESLGADGIRVLILTGDNERVARYVCSSVGIDADATVLGDQIDAMDDTALAHVAERTPVFARVSPTQKNRIILALKRRGHVVGYIGDGINDAPSLHTADVGISTANAADVAREAADILLVGRSLLVLHRGIMEGRRAFGNVTKYVLMGTSSAFGNMFSMAAAALFLPFLPMLPTQILLNNFLYDLAQVTIPADHVDEAYLRKPRRWGIPLIRNFMLVLGPVSSIFDFTTFAVLIYVFHATAPLFRTGWFIESLATQTLVLFVIRTGGNPLRSRPAAPLVITIFVVIAVAIALPYAPVAPILGFTPLPRAFYIFAALAVIAYLVAAEFAKRWAMRLDARRHVTVGASARHQHAIG